LNDDESVCGFHKPCLNLLYIIFAIIPNGIVGIVVVAFTTMDDVCGVTLNPLVPAVVFKV
jgi:hypothetical protein